MTFLDAAALATSDTFKKQVTMAVVSAAKDIAAEAWDDPTLDWNYHAKRVGLALAALQNPAEHGARFAYSVASNPAISESSSDGDVQFTVNSVWDALASILITEKPEWRIAHTPAVEPAPEPEPTPEA